MFRPNFSQLLLNQILVFSHFCQRRNLTLLSHCALEYSGATAGELVELPQAALSAPKPKKSARTMHSYELLLIDLGSHSLTSFQC